MSEGKFTFVVLDDKIDELKCSYETFHFPDGKKIRDGNVECTCLDGCATLSQGKCPLKKGQTVVYDVKLMIWEKVPINGFPVPFPVNYLKIDEICIFIWLGEEYKS